MSVNQISPEYLWWSQQQQQTLMNSPNSVPNSKSLVFAHNFQNRNDDNGEDQAARTRRVVEDGDNSTSGGSQQQLEVMFEKPLTPSDVGKLNRLVIPKQHAERHFPLNTSNGADSGGMLLSFEDEAGKFWRFRYSYWNSSQSYVLTKGWSRYVKEKRLDAGDVVIFERHPTDPDRLFIGWRRRNDPDRSNSSATPAAASSPAVGGRDFYPPHHPAYTAHQYQAADPEASAVAPGAGVNHCRTSSFNGSSSSRTLRLFGVNMEYQFDSDHSEPATPDGTSTGSPGGQQAATYQHYTHLYPQSYYGISSHMVQQDASHSQHRG